MIVNQEDLKSGNELSFEAMNTTFFISISNSTIANWQEPILSWFSYVEQEWSRFSDENELARLNNSEIGETVVLSPPLFDLLEKAEEYRQKTEGRFSPFLLHFLQVHGYRQSFPFEQAEVEEDRNLNIGTSCPFQFHHKDSSVTRIRMGMVDLGGIGKGYAVESAANWLKRFTDAEYGIVDGGGDLTVWSNGEKDWKIGISDPYEQSKEIKQITLKNGSVATSNIVYRSWWQAGQKKHHILNGKTGMPVDNGVIQATIVTTNCVDAEVGAKLCFMEDGTQLNKLLATLNPNYKVILVNSDKEIIIE